jgi:hypothetical protein
MVSLSACLKMFGIEILTNLFFKKKVFNLSCKLPTGANNVGNNAEGRRKRSAISNYPLS